MVFQIMLLALERKEKIFHLDIFIGHAAKTLSEKGGKWHIPIGPIFSI